MAFIIGLASSSDYETLRPALRNVVHDVFARELHEHMPSFRKRIDIKLPSGDSAFSWSPVDGLTLFIVLEVNRDWDAFNVNLAWNGSSAELPRTLGMEPSDAPFNRSHRFPLHRLWETNAGNPWHWEIEALPKLGASSTNLNDDAQDTSMQARASRLATEAVRSVWTTGAHYFQSVIRQYLEGTI